MKEMVFIGLMLEIIAVNVVLAGTGIVITIIVLLCAIYMTNNYMIHSF